MSDEIFTDIPVQTPTECTFIMECLSPPLPVPQAPAPEPLPSPALPLGQALQPGLGGLFLPLVLPLPWLPPSCGPGRPALAAARRRQGLLTLFSCLTQKDLQTREDPTTWEPVCPLWSDSQALGRGRPHLLLPQEGGSSGHCSGLLQFPKRLLGGLTRSHSTRGAPGGLGSVPGPAQDARGVGVKIPVLLGMSRALSPLHQDQPLLGA